MYYDDHVPPHFHARYGEYQAQIEIATGQIVNGHLPARAARFVKEWSDLRRADLEEDWEFALAGHPLVTIDPLP